MAPQAFPVGPFDRPKVQIKMLWTRFELLTIGTNLLFPNSSIPDYLLQLLDGFLPLLAV